jgi:hypothetical protein
MAVRIKGTDFVYFPVPKVGCTALKLAIMKHNNPRKYARAERDVERVHGWRGYRTPPWAWEWRSYVRPPSMRAFCVIRDPIDRFVSGYRNRIAHWRDLGDEVPGINEFALELEKHCRSDGHIRHHFMPMVEFTGRDPSFYDRVFLLEEIGSIPDYVRVPLSIVRAQEGGPTMSRANVSPEALAHLEDFYSEDYRVWGSRLQRT